LRLGGADVVDVTVTVNVDMKVLVSREVVVVVLNSVGSGNVAVSIAVLEMVTVLDVVAVRRTVTVGDAPRMQLQARDLTSLFDAELQALFFPGSFLIVFV
jgi:hypothetical protein